MSPKQNLFTKEEQGKKLKLFPFANKWFHCSKMEIVKLRKEIREVLKEEGCQGNDLKAKLQEVGKQELLRQEKIRKDEKEENKR